MSSLAVSAVSARPLCRSVNAQRPAQRRVTLCAARQQEQKVQAPKIAQVAAAGLAALFIAASPSFAADISVKAKLCATNPTSKICLRDSAKK